jgi:hypothetical protein
MIGAALLAIPAAATGEGEVVAPPSDGVIATGVRIAGIDVSGMSAEQARSALILGVVDGRMKPMLVTFKGKRFAIDPRSAGYSADIDYALAGALTFGRTQVVPAEGAQVPLKESVNKKRVRALLTRRAAKLDVAARDAVLSFAGGEPRVREARFGAKVDIPRAERLVTTALLSR